jgi:MFS transporter, AAHS family, 4-hydroxybenzoate transporter
VPTNVSNVIAEARFNRFHLRIAVLCGLMIFLDGFDLTAISFAVPRIVSVMGLDRVATAPILSAGLLGLTVGALLFGFIGDRWGVKRTFIFCGTLFGMFSFATALAPNLSTLLVIRFLAGLALGGASPISIAIASDYVPLRIRTTVVMIMYISLAVGQVAAGYAYGFLSLLGWQTVFYIGGILPIILAPLFIAVLPESLEHMVMHAAPADKINAVLRRLDPSGVYTEQEFTVSRDNREGFQPALLFQDGRAAVTAVLWATFFASLIAVYFFNNWIPTLLNGSGLSQGQIVVITTALPFGGIVGTLLAAPIVLRLGGFLTVVFGYVAAAICMLILGGGGSAFLFLVVVVLAIGIFLIGTQSVLNASCANVYPPSMRSTGVGWAFGVGRIGSVLSPAIAGVLLAMQWSPSQLFLIASVPTFLAAIGGFIVLQLVRRKRAVPVALEPGQRVASPRRVA